MPSNQNAIKTVTDKLDDMNPDELRQVRNYADNRLHETDPDGSSKDQDFRNRLADMDERELEELRDDVNDRLLAYADGDAASADESADDEKKKYIAQHGADPNAQLTSQDVPTPSDQDGKDLQDEKAREEHTAKGPAADGSHDPSK